MLDVRPFRGIRYDLKVAGSLDAVISPPYDVISPADRERFARTNPYNIVHIDLPEGAAEGDDNRYERAAALWRRWLAEGVLRREPVPSFYGYRQTYDDNGQRRVRWGLVAQVRLAEYGEGIVYPHERTLTGPREDRLRLTRATEANLSPVFGLHFGGAESLDEALAEACQGPPAGEMTDPDGVENALWVLSDPAWCRRVRQGLRSARIVIADGHHRYETALAYRRERRAAGEDDPDASWNYVLMVLVAMDSPGLTVWPTHRVLKGRPDVTAASLRSLMEDAFELQEVAGAGDRGGAALMEALASLGPVPGFAVYGGQGHGWVARPRDPEGLMARLAPDRSAAWRRLDVSVLHTGLLEAALGLDAAAQAGGEFLEYTRTAAEAVQAVDDGTGQVAFLLRPTSPEQVRDVALAGDSMPQKSTYFYPKVLTGLVFSDLATPEAPDPA